MSFTSMSMMVAYDNGDPKATPEEILMAQLSALCKLKQKPHVQLHTTQGANHTANPLQYGTLDMCQFFRFL